MKSAVKWTYKNRMWETELFGVRYLVKALKKDLWHISDSLINAIRNSDIYPLDYAEWLKARSLKGNCFPANKNH